ncbi:MAG: helix-turn-helix domain-containing protein [Pseudomonadota bacterium]
MSQQKHNDQFVDGRAQRTVRSRRKIIEAAFELYARGTLVPTAQEIADQSGMGIRTVFRHFSEMESLFVEADRLLHEQYAEQPHVQPEGGLAERSQQLVDERARIFETYAPHIRATLVQKWRYKQLAKQYFKLCQDLMNQTLYFLPELQDKAAVKKAAVDFALSFECWDRQRTIEGKSKKAIREAMADTLAMLLKV